MKKLIALATFALASQFALAADKAPTAQQQLMGTCNVEAKAKELKGDERKAYMSSCLSDGRKRQQERMAKINKEYLALKTATNEEYSLRRNEEFASMQQKANQALIELAKAEKYDVIVKDVVYVRSEFDVTDKLITIMNRQ